MPVFVDTALTFSYKHSWMKLHDGLEPGWYKECRAKAADGSQEVADLRVRGEMPTDGLHLLPHFVLVVPDQIGAEVANVANGTIADARKE